MASFLDDLMPTPDHAQALALIGMGLQRRDFSGGALAAMQHMAGRDQRDQERRLAALRMQEAEMRMAGLQRQQADDQAMRTAARDAYRTPEQAEAMSMGPTEQGPAVPRVAPGFDPRLFVDRIRQVNPVMAIELEQKLAKPEDEAIVVGNHLVRKRDGSIVFSAPDKPEKKPSAVQEYEYAREQGFNGTFEEWDTRRKQAAAPKVSVDLRDPTAVAKAGMDIQDKVRAAFKPHFTISDQYKAMQQAASDPSPQGDTALLYSFFKVLDPESTVREGELNLVLSNRSIPDRFKGYAQKLAGGGSLMPHERQDLLKQARAQVQARMPRARQDLQAYRENAQRLQLDPNLYAPDPYDGIRFDGATSSSNGGGGVQWKWVPGRGLVRVGG